MNPETRVTAWRRNKSNEHKMLVIRSTWDRSWTVVDYNPDVAPRKFARWGWAIEHARHRALVRSIKRISDAAMATADDAMRTANKARAAVSGGDAA